MSANSSIHLAEADSDTELSLASYTERGISTNVASLQLSGVASQHTGGGRSSRAIVTRSQLISQPQTHQHSILSIRESNKDEDLVHLVDSLVQPSPALPRQPRPTFSQEEGTSLTIANEPSNLSIHDQYHTPSQIPLSVFTSANRKKMSLSYDAKQLYQIFLAPDSQAELAGHCFTGIGKSGTLCLSKHCKKKHSGEKYEIEPGSILIRKSPTKGFMEPIVNSKAMHLDLISEWLSDSCTLKEWVKRFRLVEAKCETKHEPITPTDIKDEETNQQNVLALISSKKRKAASPLRTRPKIQYNAEMIPKDNQASISSEDLITSLNIMNSRIGSVIAEVEVLQQQIIAQDSTNDAALLVHEQQLKEIDSRLGTKPNFLDEEVDGPTLWSTVTQIASQLGAITKTLDSRILHQVSQLRGLIQNETIGIVQQEIISVHSRIDLLKEQLIKIAKSIKAGPTPNQDFLAPSRHNLTARPNDLSSPEAKITKLEEEIKLLKAINDSDAAWITLHYNFDSFGYIVDAHILFEHLYATILKDGDDTLTKNVTLAKNKLYTAYEAMVVTSYDRKAPKLFRENKKHQVVTNIDSYFDVIPNHKGWKAYETGFRTRILSELRDIKDSYLTHINSDLDSTTVLYRVAYQSLIFSASWVEDFERYLDEVFEEYTESKFDNRRAWNITTRLGMTLLEHIAIPRMGVRNAFQNRNRTQMKQITFFGTLQSLDRMTDIHKTGFKNCPIVANELVKVLAKNTQVEAIDNLKGDVSAIRSELGRLKSDATDIKSKANESVKLANAANNKSDQIKENVQNLSKRVKALEDKQ